MDVNEQNNKLRQLGIKGVADFDQSKSEIRASISTALNEMSPSDLRECLSDVMAIVAATKDSSTMIQVITNLGLNEFNAILAEWLAGSKQEDDGA